MSRRLGLRKRRLNLGLLPLTPSSGMRSLHEFRAEIHVTISAKFIHLKVSYVRARGTAGLLYVLDSNITTNSIFFR